jgi:hypothetical protein
MVINTTAWLLARQHGYDNIAWLLSQKRGYEQINMVIIKAVWLLTR